MLDQPQSRSGSLGSGKHLLLLPGMEARFLSRPTHITVTIPPAPSQVPSNSDALGNTEEDKVQVTGLGEES
jgi:hypothetical protein